MRTYNVENEMLLKRLLPDYKRMEEKVDATIRKMLVAPSYEHTCEICRSGNADIRTCLWDVYGTL